MSEMVPAQTLSRSSSVHRRVLKEALLLDPWVMRRRFGPGGVGSGGRRGGIGRGGCRWSRNPYGDGVISRSWCSRFRQSAVSSFSDVPYVRNRASRRCATRPAANPFDNEAAVPLAGRGVHCQPSLAAKRLTRLAYRGAIGDRFSPYRFDARFAGMWPPVGALTGRDGVTLGEDRIRATFGLLNLETPLDNLAGGHVTEDCRWYTAFGVRMSLVDDGLTFGTNRDRGGGRALSPTSASCDRPSSPFGADGDCRRLRRTGRSDRLGLAMAMTSALPRSRRLDIPSPTDR